LFLFSQSRHKNPLLLGVFSRVVLITLTYQASKYPLS
jgi:hypothetical protein